MCEGVGVCVRERETRGRTGAAKGIKYLVVRDNDRERGRVI